MAKPRAIGRSARGPAILFGVVLVLVVALTILWNVVLSRDYLRIQELARRMATEEGGAFHWTFIGIGSSLFVLIIVLLSVLAAQLFAEIRLNQRQSDFIATVTHELNSPLASIKLYAQTLRAPTLPEGERQKFLERILADVERLRALIANVLRAAQLDAAKLELSLEPTDMAEHLTLYAEEVSEVLDRRAPGSRIRFTPGGPAALVSLDGFLFRHVLDNLVDNAVKYAREGRAEIELSLAPGAPPLHRYAPQRVAVLVQDRGIGMPVDALPTVFERFHRVDDGDPRRSRHGSGLGLSIARSIVELHGGTIEALSEGKDTGVTVRIELPVAPARAGGTAAPAASAGGGRGA